MKILYLAAHQMWPLNTGARLRDYQLARQLSTRALVTFVEMCRAGDEHYIPPKDSGLAGSVTLNKGRMYSPSKIVRGLAGPIPVTVLNCWSPQSAFQLADVLRSRQFDTVQIEGVHVMAYLPTIEQSPGAPAIVVDWHNIESEMMWRYGKTTGNWVKKIAARRTAKLIERAEDRRLDACVTHTVTSERERQKLLARRPERKDPGHAERRRCGAITLRKARSQKSCHQNGQHRDSRTTILSSARWTIMPTSTR